MELLVALYPDRSRAAFEAELARLPVVLSHDADERAARALADALERRGGRVHVGEAEFAGLPGWEEPERGAGPEVDAAFLVNRRAHEGTLRPQSHRALPQGGAAQGGTPRGKAPWES